MQCKWSLIRIWGTSRYIFSFYSFFISAITNTPTNTANMIFETQFFSLTIRPISILHHVAILWFWNFGISCHRKYNLAFCLLYSLCAWENLHESPRLAACLSKFPGTFLLCMIVSDFICMQKVCPHASLFYLVMYSKLSKMCFFFRCISSSCNEN